LWTIAKARDTTGAPSFGVADALQGGVVPLDGEVGGGEAARAVDESSDSARNRGEESHDVVNGSEQLPHLRLR